MTDPTPISVAELKRRFSDVLGEVRYQHRRFVVERNGTPVAALVPLEDLGELPVAQDGFLALVGAFGDAAGFSDSLDEVVGARATQRPRPGPTLSS